MIFVHLDLKFSISKIFFLSHFPKSHLALFYPYLACKNLSRFGVFISKFLSYLSFFIFYLIPDNVIRAQKNSQAKTWLSQCYFAVTLSKWLSAENREHIEITIVADMLHVGKKLHVLVGDDKIHICV